MLDYFQPNGTECYLFEYYDEIGFLKQRACSLSRKSVQRADATKAKQYAAKHMSRPNLSDFTPRKVSLEAVSDELELTGSESSGDGSSPLSAN